ncbi:TonB-dependent receptor [Methylobacillus gramineus]|uniref:TonB-dependent receptor n=1 Tax=Methylobacillus gramineus TaxID=755169 RepID=UPI001D000557|nr:TonB-dependent receptor [Methylobacillus gramineus]MCB5185103.1 TonB-dependent receptor [Methylobacillus gramineus]
MHTPQISIKPLARQWRAAILALSLGSTLSSMNMVHAAETSTPLHEYHIPAGPLSQALSHFAAESGILLSADASLADGKTSTGLNGRYTVESGFEKLLVGSGLSVKRQDNQRYTIIPREHRAEILPEIKVSAGDQNINLLPSAYAGEQVAKGVRLGVLGNTSNMRAPFSTTSYTAISIQNQQARTIAESINRDPSVRYTVLPGGNVDNLYIRGFPIWEGNSGEIAFDGIYGIAPNYRVRTEYVERIEVIKGPGALLFGISPNGSVGGVINIAPKRANRDVTNLTTTLISNNQAGGHLDIGRRFGSDAQLGVRFNGSYYNGDTAVDKQSTEGHTGALALDFEGERFRSTLDIILQKEDINAPSRPLMPSGISRMPSAPDGKRNVTQPWEWSENKEQSVLLRTEYDINQHLSLFANAGTSSAKVSRVYDSAPRLVNESGTTQVTPTYGVFDVARTTYDAGLRSKFQTGFIAHSVTFQTSVYRDRLDRALRAGTTVTSNIYDTTDYAEQQISRPGNIPRIYDNQNTSFALVDTMSILDDKLQLSLGLRHQRIKTTNYNALGLSSNNRYDRSVSTPAVGIVIQPVKNLSLYANYIEGLSKGDIAPPAAVNYGEVLAPYKSKQYEAGIKYDTGHFMTTAALFQIEKPSGGLSNGVFSSNSEQRNRGLELYGYGTISPALRAIGGITLLDSEITSSALSNVAGNRPIGTSKQQANLGLEWDVSGISGLTLSTDLIYTGKQYVNQANTLSIPSWTRIDIGGRYQTSIAGRNTTLRATIQNLADRDYWSGITSWGAVSPAIPRTFVLSASIDL